MGPGWSVQACSRPGLGWPQSISLGEQDWLRLPKHQGMGGQLNPMQVAEK